MLFNPNWKKEQKYDVHSIESLIQWLEDKDPSEDYAYTNNRHCLLAQYYKAKGFKRVAVDAHSLYHGIFNWTRLPYNFDWVGLGHPRTFGAALQRARKLERELHAA